MKKLYIFSALTLFFTTATQAQNLVNDSGIINIAAGDTLSLAGNFTNANNAQVNNSGVFALAGNFTSTGTSQQGGSGTYRFGGQSMQSLQVDNNLLASAIEVDNTTGITLATDIVGVQSLQFTNGHIFSGAHILSLDNVNGAVTGADSTRFFVCGDFGEFKYKDVGNGDTAFYPVGYLIDTYNPLTVVNNGTADNLSVRVFNDVLDGGTQGNTINPASQQLVPRTWVVKEDVQGGTQPVYTFQWSSPVYTTATSTYWDNSSGGVYGWHPYLNQNVSPVSQTAPYTTTIQYQQPYWPDNSNEQAIVVGFPGLFFYPESVNENPVGNILVFPNPQAGAEPLNLVVKPMASQTVTVNLIDATGRIVFGNNQMADGTGTIRLNTPLLPQGIYMLTLQSRDGFYATKLQVK